MRWVFETMLRLLRLRRSPASSTKADKDAAAAPAMGGSTATASSALQLRRHIRRRRLQCMLLLHAVMSASLMALMAASILSRQQRHRDLAQQLLRAGNAAKPPRAPDAFESAQLCGEALQLPQVALLFLVKGAIHHEHLWRLWFQSAAGLIPAEALVPALCTQGSNSSNDKDAREQRRRVLAACSGWEGSSGGARQAAGAPSAEEQVPLQEHQAVQQPAFEGASKRPKGPRQQLQQDSSSSRALSNRAAFSAAATRPLQPAASGVLGEQLLFDVYVHPHPSFKAYPEGSLFRGRELPRVERVLTQWGQHSLVSAAKALLRAAYRNPRNQKFVLLSESDLPLYSPHLMYTQLVGEPLSRLNACNTTRGWRRFEHRWVPRMETAALKAHHWRKSWQWFVLSRGHAELALRDSAVEASFRAHCRTMWEPERKEERECYSDEHYLPTLLAVHGRDRETDCQGWLMDTDWSRVRKDSPHPWEYAPHELSGKLLHRLRHPEVQGCSHAARAAATARSGFVSAADLAGAASAAGPDQGEAALAGTCRQLQQQLEQHKQQHKPLGPRCRLLARKFLNTTVLAALAAAAPCDSHALILNNGTCPGETLRQAALRRAWQQAAPLALLLLGCQLLAVLAALCLGVVGPASQVALGRRGSP